MESRTTSNMRSDKQVVTNSDNRLVEPQGSRVMELIAATATFVGIAGLLVLMAQGAWAAPPSGSPPPGGGFDGSKPFPNAPFAGNPGGKANNFFEDDFEDGDLP